MNDWPAALRLTERLLSALRVHQTEITRARAAGDEAALATAAQAAIGVVVNVAALAGASTVSSAASEAEQEMRGAILDGLEAAAGIFDLTVDFDALGITSAGRAADLPRVLN